MARGAGNRPLRLVRGTCDQLGGAMIYRLRRVSPDEMEALKKTTRRYGLDTIEGYPLYFCDYPTEAGAVREYFPKPPDDWVVP